DRVVQQAKRDAQERLSQAVAAARSAAEEKLAEAEATAMEWVAAAEAEAERVAQSHIVAANQSAKATPTFSESISEPSVGEFVDEKPSVGTETPPEVSDGTGGSVPPTKKRVIRRS
ncbi:hypothetical protein, partial [Aeromicrobium sp. 50.2.37]|uniref:hypothetical protein n=1 Tax=Aeromicrobium sp. 50.2.37 TaxID=2969305 RepID=UPI00214FD2C9